MFFTKIECLKTVHRSIHQWDSVFIYDDGSLHTKVHIRNECSSD